LNRLGIYSIKGNIVVDDRNFEDDDFGKGWLNEYDRNWFAPPSGAFCLNNNSTEIIVTPEEINQFALISSIPAENNFEIYNKIITGTENSQIAIEVNRKGNNVLQLTGSIPAKSEPYVIYVPIDNPSMFFANNFYETLLLEGFTVTGYPSLYEENVSSDQDNLLFLFEHHSIPLASIVSEINKNSNNLYAEQLLKTLGFEIFGFGSTDNGILAMKDLIQKMGVNPNNLNIVDGSGLSTFNLVTPKQIVNLLSYMYKSDAFGDFYESLAVAGFDGTLSDRMKKTKAENNFRGKSGYLENTRGLAGYLKSADGEPLAVALIVNNFLVPSQLANYIQDKVCNRLANFKRN
jgi:D-alanyl-D-alanine carboxypeptidase/D-alanyl-D-alanine-endopeptidase (penicillin-binding protein 4)